MTAWGEEIFEQVSDQEPAPALFYATLEDFVGEQLAPMYRRALDSPSRAWCPQWWKPAEAISRLKALWRAWEHLRLDPATGISVWFCDHADHHTAVLLDSEGPYKRCSPSKGHKPLDELPLEAAPEGLFTPGGASALAT
jgi:hypothetical protein